MYRIFCLDLLFNFLEMFAKVALSDQNLTKICFHISFYFILIHDADLERRKRFHNFLPKNLLHFSGFTTLLRYSQDKPMHYPGVKCQLKKRLKLWNRVLDPDSIRSVDPYPESGSGSRRAIINHQSRNKFRNFMF
jgi:hypothetical protein